MPFGNRFRRRHQHTSARLHPAAIVGICLAVTILVTIVIGNLLKVWLDDETYRNLTEGKETEAQAEKIQETPVRNVNAYPFVLGTGADGAVGQPSVSVSLNTPNGKLLYTSEVGTHLGLECNEKAVLFDTLGELSAFVPYISGTFYPQAFLQEAPDLRYAVTCEESALLREFLRAGGSEVLLLDLPINAEHLDAVCEYVKTVKFAAGNAPVGVAIPYGVATDPDNWELLATLEPLCDFFAVDLTAEAVDENDLDETGISQNAAALLTNCSYLLSQYDARLLFSENQTALISTAAAQARPDFQVVTYLPKATTPESNDTTKP